MIVFRLAMAVLAIVMIVLGVIATPTPIPFGLVFIVLGFSLLAIAAPALVRRIRRRWRWLDRRLIALEKKAPRWLARRLRETEPPEEDGEDEGNDDDAEKALESVRRRPALRRRERPNPLHSVN